MPGQVDFYNMLSGLGGQIAAQRKAAAQQAAFANATGPDGTADFGKVILGLNQVGDYEGAARIQQLKFATDDRARQARLDARQVERDAVDDRFRTASLDLQRRAAARADDRTPAGFERTETGVRPIPGGPQDPEHLARVNAVEGKNNFQQIVEQRKQQAQAVGLDTSSPGYQSFVLTGRMPREDAQPLTATDKKAILEADEAVQTNQAAIDSLKRASTLSSQAFEGPTAGARGYLASFLGPESEFGRGGIATENLTNEVMTNALGQLKAVFGGNPTEGERKILLDIQGAATKPHAVRVDIFNRAMAAAEKRLSFNRQRAEALRGNTYYKPQTAVASAPVQQTQGITQEQFNALPSGSVFTAPDGTQRVKP